MSLHARAVIVAAHPDDEILGMGLHLPLLTDLAAIIHVTDGAPRGSSDIQNAGCETWEQYRDLRRSEFLAALARSGARCEETICAGCPDQQASLQMAEVSQALARLFERIQPLVLFTHAYEGGHPDHDATAAAVHLAKAAGGHSFDIFEFSSYHAGHAGFECECFLEHSGPPGFPMPLSDDQRREKRQILSCYASQQLVLRQFPLQNEPIRRAPDYDFCLPPHEGVLYYERFPWGMDGKRWRTLAADAFRQAAFKAEVA